MRAREKQRVIQATFNASGVQTAKWDGTTLVVDVDYSGGHNNNTEERMRHKLQYHWADRKVSDLVGSNYRLNDVTPR